MSNLSTIAKRIVPEPYKKLVQAGYLNEKLQITEAGRTMLDHITLKEFEGELAAAADTKIAADKQAAKDCSGEDEADDN